MVKNGYVELLIRRVDDKAILPSYGRENDAAFDLYSLESAEIQHGEIYKLRTGIACSFPPEFVCIIKGRSGLAARGITILGGVIDATYRGEWCVQMTNANNASYQIKAGDRIAQAMLIPIPRVKFVEVQELPDSERGMAGFGSSGR